jgi:hypothetical protein
MRTLRVFFAFFVCFQPQGVRIFSFMKSIPLSRLLKTAFITLIACALGSPLAFGQATRTWVSGVGDDVNPCSRTAPCKTFAGAISKTATAGEINALDPAGFGGVTITKSITISAEGVEGGVLVSGTNAIIVNAPNTSNVVLRGLDVEGLGTGLDGIKILGAKTVSIENCTVNNFTQFGIEVVPSANSVQVNIINTIVRNCIGATGGAVQAKGTGAGNEANVTITNSNLSFSQAGYKGTLFSTATLDKCVIFRNTANGVVLDGAGGAAIAHVNNCVISDNLQVGVKTVNAVATANISGNVITHNATGVNIGAGTTVNSHGNNAFSDNTPSGDVVGTISNLSPGLK